MPWPTVSEAAADAYFWVLTCQGCGREHYLSAMELVRRGHGHRRTGPELFDRMTCTACGRRGVTRTVHGYWTGPPEHRPADWAERQDAYCRMMNERGRSPDPRDQFRHLVWGSDAEKPPPRG